MASERYTRTNQKLYFASLALKAWQEAEAEQALNVSARIQAAREAALFHLYGALLGLCHEIAGYYRLPEAQARTVEQLLDPARLAESPGPELGELVALAEQPGSWVQALLKAWQQLFEPPQAERKAKVDPSLALIAAVDVGAPVSQALPCETLTDWHAALSALAVRFREGMSEW